MDPKWSGKEGELNRQLRERARAGHRILTADELAGLGVTPQMIKTRKHSGRLIPVLNRVYALPGTSLDFMGRFRAAVCSAGPNVYLSHQSALALHGLVSESGHVHLIGKAGAFRIDGARKWQSSEFRFEVECHQTRSLPEAHLTDVRGIRTTTAERALRDYAATASPAEIARALTQGEKLRAVCWETLRKLVTGSTGHKGMRMLLREIEHWEPVFVDASSEPELDFLLMIRSRPMPMPAVNVKIGQYVVDFFWKHLRLAVELDPYGTHSGKASHLRDHRKSIELETAGIRVIRFTWEDRYLHEERTATELLDVMEQQAALLHVPLFPPEGETENAA